MADADRQGPGLAALQAHVERVDGGPPSSQLFPRNPSRFQRGGPLHAVNVHALEHPAHWHLVTCGLSELFDKESTDKEVSGWGFELTFRVARLDEEPPAWASDLLTNLAAYVWQTGHDFAAGDHVDLRGPMRLDTDTHITAAAVATDPALTTMRGPFGRVSFLQLVGLTADELELCRAWRTDAVLELLAEADPLFVTALDRPSLLDDPAAQQRVHAGMAGQEGTRDQLRVGSLRLIRRGRRRERAVVQLGAGAATGLGPALRRRLTRAGAHFQLIGGAVVVTFKVAEPAGVPRWSVSGDEARVELRVEVRLADVADLAGLFTGQVGSTELASLAGLRFVVLP